MAKQTVLLYNCSGPQWTKLHQMLMMLRFRIRVIPPQRYHLKLSDLAAGLGEDGQPEQAFPESMLVFCGVGEPQLDAVLNAIRLAKLPPIHLKAVLTQTNQDWDSHQLRQELLQEQQEIAAGQTKP